MEQKADKVHAYRLKPYKLPTSHSIRAQYNDKEKVTQRTTVSNRVRSPSKAKKSSPETEDLVEKLHTFLNPGEENAGKTIKPALQAPSTLKRITKHMRHKSSQEYLVHDEDKEPATGTWMRHQEVLSTVLSNYLMTQQSYPSTRAKAHAIPTIKSIWCHTSATRTLCGKQPCPQKQ